MASAGQGQGLQNIHELAPLLARLHIEGEAMIFGSGSQQDPDNSDAMIVALSQDGLGLPDRDYYTKDDPKSKGDPPTITCNMCRKCSDYWATRLMPRP